MKKRLVLASASPRRRELMEIAGYEFEIMTSDADEIKGGVPATELVMKNALAKAEEISQRIPDGVVLGADTVVCLGDEILGKPKDREDAFRMLSNLSGSYHSVITGYAVVGEGVKEMGFCESKVKFRNLSPQEIDAYIATGEPMDKAGAYGIQERASLFVEKIDGDFFNIMGLPVGDIYPILKKMGIDPSWQKAVL